METVRSLHQLGSFTADAPPATRSEALFGEILSPHFQQPSSLFVISSDFCHWGSRFSYTFYDHAQVSQACRAAFCRLALYFSSGLLQ